MRWLLAASLACVACAHPAPVVQPTPPPLGRVVFTVDVQDSTRICLQTTQFMRFDDPNLPDVVCMETVGDLRYRAVRLRAAQ